MPKFLVEYTLPYEHVVRVGITAKDAQAAEAEADRLFKAGDLWNNTSDVPVLYDEYEETGDAGVALEFRAPPVDDFPPADMSIKTVTAKETALRAARLLVVAYADGAKNGGSIDWDQVNLAYEEALQALECLGEIPPEPADEASSESDASPRS